MKILSSKQIREADAYTIKHEPISSLDLMERASKAFVDHFLSVFESKVPVKIFCGTGNNGGDGLAIGRLLREKKWNVLLYIVGETRNGSDDFKANLDRSGLYGVIKSASDFPVINEEDIVIDGLFGSGLSRPLEGVHSQLIDYLNDQSCRKVAIDIASGLLADSPLSDDSSIFKPDFTLTFQLPKLTFFLPESFPYVGDWRILDIGLDASFIEKQKSIYLTTEPLELKKSLPQRSKFSHKSQVGRLIIVAGSKGKIGAAILCARAAFKTGVGLVNVCSPKCGIDILQISIPEAMVIDGGGQNEIHRTPKFEDTVAIGPGIGTKSKTITAIEELIKVQTQPLVLDADGINILAKKKQLLRKLPKETILTPHPGEFERLVGGWANDFEKLEKLRSLCKEYKLNVVLKGAYSAICNSKGGVYFNTSGNPSMATAGSGDVLTGVIGSFLAQGLEPFNALRLGVFLHGIAGDMVVEQSASPWILASDIINHLPQSVGIFTESDL